jgi:hypothetical protein
VLAGLADLGRTIGDGGIAGGTRVFKETLGSGPTVAFGEPPLAGALRDRRHARFSWCG